MQSVLFNGIDITTFDGVKMFSYSLPVAPSLKTTGINVSSADGVFRVHSPYSAVTFTIDIVVEAVTTSQAGQRLRNIVTWFSNQGDMKITFTDDSSVFRVAKYQSSETYKIIDGIVMKGLVATITFHQADPFVYGTDANTVQQQIPSGGTVTLMNTGLPTWYNLYLSLVPLDNPTNIAYGASSLGNTYAAVAADATTNYTVIINTPDTEYYTEVKYGGIIGSGDIVLISTEDYTIYKNGAIDIVNFLGDVLSPLQTGTNTITVTNNQGQQIYVMMEWYTRYL